MELNGRQNSIKTTPVSFFVKVLNEPPKKTTNLDIMCMGSPTFLSILHMFRYMSPILMRIMVTYHFVQIAALALSL